MRLFGGRIERGGRGRMRAGALPAAEELAQHVCHWAHAAMKRSAS